MLLKLVGPRRTVILDNINRFDHSPIFIDGVEEYHRTGREEKICAYFFTGTEGRAVIHYDDIVEWDDLYLSEPYSNPPDGGMCEIQRDGEASTFQNMVPGVYVSITTGTGDKAVVTDFLLSGLYSAYILNPEGKTVDVIRFPIHRVQPDFYEPQE